jgi:hypothetical protein
MLPNGSGSALIVSGFEIISSILSCFRSFGVGRDTEIGFVLQNHPAGEPPDLQIMIYYLLDLTGFWIVALNPSTPLSTCYVKPLGLELDVCQEIWCEIRRCAQNDKFHIFLSKQRLRKSQSG